MDQHNIQTGLALGLLGGVSGARGSNSLPVYRVVAVNLKSWIRVLPRMFNINILNSEEKMGSLQDYRRVKG